MNARYLRGLGDTNILIYLERLAPEQLPAELVTSTVTLAELSAGVHSADFRGLEAIVTVVPVPVPPPGP